MNRKSQVGNYTFCYLGTSQSQSVLRKHAFRSRSKQVDHHTISFKYLLYIQKNGEFSLRSPIDDACLKSDVPPTTNLITVRASKICCNKNGCGVGVARWRRFL